jgi:hypothetical protein
MTTEKKLVPIGTHSCAIRERTGDGVSVGRCWFHVGDNDVCPRHGDVKVAMAHYRATGKLTDEKDHVRVFPPSE